MARQVLTDRTLKALKPAPAGKRIDLMDAVVPGLGVRVTDKPDAQGKAAQRTFVLVTRYPGSTNPARRALGEYGKLSLDQARDKAREWHELIRKGVDPREREDKQRNIEEERRSNTFGAVAEDYFKRHLKGQRRADVSEREVRRELISRWGSRPVDEITKRDIVAMVDEIVDRGAKRQAHNILGHAKTIFNWAINRGVYGLESSPCDRLKPSAIIGEKVARQRVLNDAELQAVWEASAAMGPYGPLVRLLMLTGQRKAEVSDAKWSEFDLDKGVWTIPQERFKSGTSHLVPLSSEAIALLRALPRWTRGDHVFSTTGGKTAVNGFAKAKERLDRLIREETGTSLEPWVFHDLRRTVRTRLSSLRVPEPVAEMVIGHARKGLARVYDMHGYLDEMREALDAWAGGLRSIVEPPPATVA